VRPGGRIGFEPNPYAAIELTGSAGVDAWSPRDVDLIWEAGLGISGRLWFTGQPRNGLFVLGRFNIGATGDQRAQVGPWTGLGVGFGGRVASIFNVEATISPEWVANYGARYRTELSVGVVFDSQRKRRQTNTIKHRPRKPPRR
ncbi:MAG: hypothetical protein AAFV53_01395, partial [Myxococcota bacterium]